MAASLYDSLRSHCKGKLFGYPLYSSFAAFMDEAIFKDKENVTNIKVENEEIIGYVIV